MSRFKKNMKGVFGLLIFTVIISVNAANEENSSAGNTSSRAKDAGPMTMFVLECWDRAFNGSPNVFEECFTPDFKMLGPETKIMSTESDGSMRGKLAIDTYYQMNHGDAQAWGTVEFETVWSVEADNTVVRMMSWVSKEPHGRYAGFENLPSDLEVTINGIFIDTLRDGKIADQFFTYDTMGFMMDIGQGDMGKVADAMENFGDMIEVMKKAKAEGKTFNFGN